MKAIKSVDMLVLLVAIGVSLLCPLASSQHRDFKRAFNLARDIYYKQDQLALEEVYLKLSRIKQAVKSMVYVDVPMNLPAGVDRELIINILGLERVTEVNSDKCLQSHVNIRHGNVHKSNYIELRPILDPFFPGKNVQKLMNQHSAAQRYICRIGLVVHMHQKWSKLVQTHPHMEKFKVSFLANFPNETPISQLTNEQKLNGIIRFIKQTLMLDDAIANYRQISWAYSKFKINDCHNNIQNAFHTLMMTYEETGRQNGRVEREHRDLVRLYDLCFSLPNSIRQLGFGKVARPSKLSIDPIDLSDVSEFDLNLIDAKSQALSQAPAKRVRFPRAKILQDTLAHLASRQILDMQNKDSDRFILDTSFPSSSSVEQIHLEAENVQAGSEPTSHIVPSNQIAHQNKTETDQNISEQGKTDNSDGEQTS